MAILDRNLRIALLAAVAVVAVAGCSREDAAATGADAAETAGIADTLGKAASAAVEAVTPLTPRQRLERALASMDEVESYQMDVTTTGPSLPAGMGNMKMEFVAPDRHRITTPMGTHTVIGNTSYTAMGGGKPMVLQLDEPYEPDVADVADVGVDDDTTVEDLGSDSVDGQPATKYLVRDAGPEAATLHLWIGSDDRLLQLRTTDPDGIETTLRYSRYNDGSIRIDPPQ